MQQGTASTRVDASPEHVWALVTDVTRTGEWSPECERCEWLTEDRLTPGARFVGHNRQGRREWSMEAVVDAVEPTRVFSFHTERDGQSRTRWTWQVEPTDGSTTLTQSWERLWRPPVVTRLAERLLMGGRIKHNQANLEASLERVKAIAEA